MYCACTISLSLKFAPSSLRMLHLCTLYSFSCKQPASGQKVRVKFLFPAADEENVVGLCCQQCWSVLVCTITAVFQSMWMVCGEIELWGRPGGRSQPATSCRQSGTEGSCGTGRQYGSTPVFPVLPRTAASAHSWVPDGRVQQIRVTVLLALLASGNYIVVLSSTLSHSASFRQKGCSVVHCRHHCTTHPLTHRISLFSAQLSSLIGCAQQSQHLFPFKASPILAAPIGLCIQPQDARKVAQVIPLSYLQSTDRKS